MALLYQQEDKIVTITLNRPDALNAFDPEQCTQFSEAILKFRDDKTAWVAIITGAGERAFSAGADLKKLIPAMASGEFEVPPTIMRGLNIYKPIIAAVNGLAFGGGLEVVLACDLRVAAENATFGCPEVRWSLIPGWGGTQRLPRFIPRAIASQIVLAGDPISAQQALSVGLINEVVPRSELMSAAKKWANRICENGPLGVWAAKEAMMRGVNMTLEDGLRLEQLIAHNLEQTEDAQEGPRAFAEKRKPVFKLR